MINNSRRAGRRWLGQLALLALLGCKGAQHEPLGYQGVVEYESRILAFEVSGRLQTVLVRQGDVVHKGQELAFVDDQLAQLALQASQDEALAALSQTKVVKQGARPEDVRAMTNQVAAAKALEDQIFNNLARTERLVREGARPVNAADDLRSELERARQTRMALQQQLAALRSGARAPEIATVEARAQAASAAAGLARAKLQRYHLVADGEAYVLDAAAKVGEVVAAGTPILTVADTQHPYADVFVPQNQMHDLREGMAAQLRVDSYRGPFAARIEHIAAQTEFTPRFLFSDRERSNLVYRVRVRVSDDKRQLRAGLPAFVTLADQPVAKP